MKTIPTLVSERYPSLKQDGNGNYVCRGCRNKIGAGRRSWCSKECFEDKTPAMIYNRLMTHRNSCNRCNISGEKFKLELDHIIELADGGKTVFSNCQLLCHDCHVGKTTKSRLKRNARNDKQLVLLGL